MNCTPCTAASVFSFPSSSLSNLAATRTLLLRRSFTRLLSATHHALRIEKISFRVRASTSEKKNSGNGGGTGNWVNRLPTGAIAADKVLRLIAGATASPIRQYASSPSTFLHSVDPRIKLVWLLALVVLPARSHIILRFGLVIYLALLSVWILPRQAWVDQLGRVSLLSGIVFIMLGLGSDGVPSLVQSRTPPPAMMGLSNLPLSVSDIPIQS